MTSVKPNIELKVMDYKLPYFLPTGQILYLTEINLIFELSKANSLTIQ